MIRTGIELFLNFYQGFLLIAFLSGSRCSKKVLLYDILFVTLCGLILSAAQFIDSISENLVFFVPFAYLMAIKKAPWYSAILWTLVEMVLILGTLTIVSSSISAFTGFDYDDLLNQSNLYMIYAATSWLATSIAFLVAKTLKQKGISEAITLENILFIILLVVLLIIGELTFSLQFNTDLYDSISIWIVACSLIVGALIMVLRNTLNKAAARQKAADLSLQALQIEQQHISEIQAVYSRMLLHQHDLKHRLSIAESMTEMFDAESQADFKSLLRYDAEEHYITGRVSVDALLSTKAAVMSQNGIRFIFHQYPLNSLPMENADICLLLSNLLDNAIEGANRIQLTEQPKTITLGFGVSAQMFCITCVNDADLSTVKYASGKLLSSKNEPVFHGYGTETIRRIVEKYGGYVDFIPDSGQFRTEIFIPIEDTK